MGETGAEGDGGADGQKPRTTESRTADSRSARARALLDAARSKSQSENERRAADRARDQALVEAARQGDSRAFRKLVEAHQGRLFAVSYGMLKDRDEALDVVQDAFIKAHRKLAEFEGNSAFSTWLYRIAVNLCIDKKRADARRRKVDLDDAQAHLSDDSLYADADITPRLSGSNPLKNAGNQELGREMGRAMALLSEDHRSILLLREVEGMSYEEISETLGIPKGTVMSRLFHARKNLQRLLRPFLGLPEGAGLDGAPMEGRGDDAQADRGEEGAPARRRKS